MAKKVILKDLNDIEVLPITRGELVLDASGNPALHSTLFLATDSLPGLMSSEDKYKLDHLEDSGPGANNKVAQINTTTNDVYRLLFSETADDTDRTEKSRKSANLTFNPNTGVLNLTGAINANGGTITGGSGVYTPLMIKNINLSEVWIGFQDSIGTCYIGSSKGVPSVNMGADNKTIIHSGNIGSQSVDSANKLKNKVKIWGLDFDGSNNIDGDFTMANTKSIQGIDSSGAARTLLSFTSNNDLFIGRGSSGAGYPTKVCGYSIQLCTNSDQTERVRISSSGNVGIGTTDPKYKLDVKGVIYTNSQVVSPYFMAGLGVEGLYMSAGGISWHDTTYNYKAVLIACAQNAIALKQPTTVDSTLSVTGTGTFNLAIETVAFNDSYWSGGIRIDGSETVRPSVGFHILNLYGRRLFMEETNGDLMWEYSTTNGKPTYHILHSGNAGEYTIKKNTKIVFNEGLNEAGYGFTGQGWIVAGSAFIFGANSEYRMAIQSSQSKLYWNYCYDSSWVGWKTIAFTDSDITGNASTADKLKNKVKIWGLDFDGSKDVSGVLTLGTKYITGTSGANILDSLGEWVILGSGIADKGFPTYIDGHTIRLRYGTAHTEGVRISSSGNVGIGTTSPQSKLSIYGNIDSFKETGDYSGVIGLNRKATTGGLYNSSYHGFQIHNKKGDLYIFVEKTDSTESTPLIIKGDDSQITIAKSIFSGNSAFGQGRLELSGTTPFIDFHFNESTADYTSRIIEESSGELTCKGRWKVGGTLTANSNLSVAGSTTLKSMSATTGSFSGQITSTVADGTAPLVVTSTSRVDNLNADAVDGFHMRQWFTNASDITNTAMFWQASGNCSDVSSMGYAALINVIGDTGRRWQIWNSRGDHLLYWRPEKSDMSDWADVHTLIDDKNISNYLPKVTDYYWANVLISKTSNDKTTPTFANTTVNGIVTVNGPQCAITVNSSCKGAYADFMRMLNPNMSSTYHTAHLAFGYALSAYNLGYIGFKFVEKDSKSNMVTIGLHSADHILNVLASGNVGIGTTSPDSKLHVTGTTKTLRVNIYGGEVTDYTKGLYFLASDASSRARLYYNGNTDTGLLGLESYYSNIAIILPSTKNVGIGTTNPKYKLDVNGALRANGNVLLEAANNTTGGGIAFWNASGWVNGTINAKNLILNYAGGNVGIGTLNPAYKLDVSGIAKANKVLIYDGTNAVLSLRTTTAGEYAYLAAYNTGGQYGADVVLHSGSAMVLGAGESAASMYDNNVDSLRGSENLYLTADLLVKIFTNCDSIGNRRHAATFTTDGYSFFHSYINIGGHEKNASSPSYVWGSNSSDNYLRSYLTSSLSVGKATYATNSTYLYASDSPYRYGDSAPYYMKMRYNTNGDNRWYLSVYPETPKTVAVDYAYSAGNADTVDNYHASSLVKFYLSPMDSGATANSAKTWFTNTMPSSSGAIVYNVPGSEKTIIAGKSSGAYGHMLLLNYDDTYLRILRYAAGSWKSTDWEKISAGYADSAGTSSNVVVNNSDANSTYRMVWHSGNTLYGTGGIYCNPSSDYLYANSVVTSDWFRSTGNTGWFSNTHGGGIYMADSTWVRIYNDKKFYVNNSSYDAIHSAGGVYVVGCVHSYANYLKSTCNGHTVTIGSMNSSWCHIETSAPLFYFNKDVQVDGHLYEYSDIRKKNIIQKLEDIDFSEASVVQFKWKHDPKEVHVGVIALEIEELLPEVVNTDCDGYKSVDYGVLGTVSGVIAIKKISKLLEKVKELEKEIEILKSKN